MWKKTSTAENQKWDFLLSERLFLLCKTWPCSCLLTTFVHILDLFSFSSWRYSQFTNRFAHKHIYNVGCFEDRKADGINNTFTIIFQLGIQVPSRIPVFFSTSHRMRVSIPNPSSSQRMLHFTLYGIFRYCPLEWILLLVAAPGLAGERGTGIGQLDDCMVLFITGNSLVSSMGYKYSHEQSWSCVYYHLCSVCGQIKNG